MKIFAVTPMIILSMVAVYYFFLWLIAFAAQEGFWIYGAFVFCVWLIWGFIYLSTKDVGTYP